MSYTIIPITHNFNACTHIVAIIKYFANLIFSFSSVPIIFFGLAIIIVDMNNTAVITYIIVLTAPNFMYVAIADTTTNIPTGMFKLQNAPNIDIANGLSSSLNPTIDMKNAIIYNIICLAFIFFNTKLLFNILLLLKIF